MITSVVYSISCLVYSITGAGYSTIMVGTSPYQCIAECDLGDVIRLLQAHANAINDFFAIDFWEINIMAHDFSQSKNTFRIRVSVTINTGILFDFVSQKLLWCLVPTTLYVSLCIVFVQDPTRKLVMQEAAMMTNHP